jgi:putative glutamine amidotransferase
MKIGLTYTGSDVKHDNYVQWLMDSDHSIEVVQLSSEDGLVSLTGCDGLVLSGGVDIDPELYEGSRKYIKSPEKGWQTERDLFEQAILQMAWEQGLPVMGVCRGLQLINITCGGTLVQDLGTEGDLVHENELGVDKMHRVTILEGGLLGEITGMGVGIANSAHHQAIDGLGEGLMVHCRAEDGTIEGIGWAEPAGKPFLLAVQWHPERMYRNGLADTFLYRSLRDRFIGEIKKNEKK